MEDIIYYSFFINEDKFTVENYGEDGKGFAVFHEGALVAEIESDDRKVAEAAALTYYKKIRY